MLEASQGLFAQSPEDQAEYIRKTFPATQAIDNKTYQIISKRLSIQESVLAYFIGCFSDVGFASLSQLLIKYPIREDDSQIGEAKQPEIMQSTGLPPIIHQSQGEMMDMAKG